jgi:hypothetical protein
MSQVQSRLSPRSRRAEIRLRRHPRVVVSKPSKDLLKAWGVSTTCSSSPSTLPPPSQDSVRRRRPRLPPSAPFGYWEAKDESDDLDREIESRARRGYPRDNIIFEDGRTAVLIQTPAKPTLHMDASGDARPAEQFFSYGARDHATFRTRRKSEVSPPSSSRTIGEAQRDNRRQPAYRPPPSS